MPETYNCEHCEKHFTNRRHYELHVNGHLRNSCQLCGLPCNSRKVLSSHMVTVHGCKLNSESLGCKFCPKTFVQKRSLHSHYKSAHKDKDGVCVDCGQLFNSGQEVAEHRAKAKHGASFVCYKCGETFTRSQQYKLHLQRHDTYSCVNCNAYFANFKKLNAHLKQCIYLSSDILKPPNHIKTKETSNGVVYECKKCQKTFKKKKYYRRHIKTTAHLSVDQNDVFYCAHCSKIFYYKRNLLHHLNSVHFKPHNSYTCEVCGKRFRYRNNYKRHKDSHLQIRDYVCETCGACFYRKGALDDHRTAIHSDEKNFVCNLCGSNFKLKSILVRHMRQHAETKRHECHCKRVYKFASNLLRHQVIAHNQMNNRCSKVKRLVQDDCRQSPLMVMQEEKKMANFKRENIGDFGIEDNDVQYSMIGYSDNLDLSNADIAEKVLRVASSSDYKIECEENSCYPGIHPPIETSLVCSLNDSADLSSNSSQQYVLSDYVVPHQFPFLNI
ncbi:zinc finger protein 555-like [Adelges cooleyi]|uniref:zinc finger protein 555-like n=1 Tax=Adelges cooleyi TaxID=133065 RepID=UPI0021806FC6|nr:zinc finger protein 555-like [Adelges cooleyi]XP_050443120.1 zinc finger protein 555-like [Adelges cooleyi]XP_050443121.1 zinc finger protein 555-like [Adelges cooleyi]XP_050443122.1 zinc finger protein 555-like [Adelges cooleyi]XP_050443123.1 zinc finger protein 555-like [Adelges cooleyi]